ncbi:hypothetical protein GJAV_G00196810 [Gymnothorax javanicus]|nr:hypothetical protein GJAV_G00196810 [Gymnothorax javanicus]
MIGESVFFNRQISYLGDFTWKCMSGQSVSLKPVPVQCLSELERARLQAVAFNRLNQDYDLGCQITIPNDGRHHKKSLRKKLDSLSKEKSKDKEFASLAFGIPLSQVIANDRSHKQRPDPLPEESRDPTYLVSSILQFAMRKASKELSGSESPLSSSPETSEEHISPNTPESALMAHRRGGMSVDCITDLDDSQSHLLEALQLSQPAGSPSKKEKHGDVKLSLNPIYRLVPRLVDSCCHHLEKYGIQTVGIFRVGSSKKRVRQLREEFDRGADILLEEDHSVHDVAALLKEFLRDLPDPLLTRELYTAFINTTSLDCGDMQSCLQLLVYLLPPCNSDTLHRLLEFLSTVAAHSQVTADKGGQEVAGNKMNSMNLATIFGPNLLHKQKSSEKEFCVQSSARAEESTAVIEVLQRMIDTCDSLFMVSPDLQNEVLMSLLDTDPDVVDYLLRRKDSQASNVELLDSDVPFTLTERCSSSESYKNSSGELSPYDNDSSLLSDEFLLTMAERVKGGSTGSGSSPWSPKDELMDDWEAWHTLLSSELKDPANHGSCTTVLHSFPEGHCDQSGDRKARQPQTSLGVAKTDSQLQDARRNSSPGPEQRQDLVSNRLPHRDSQSETSCTEDLPQESEAPPCSPSSHYSIIDTTVSSQTRQTLTPTVPTPDRGPSQCRGLGPQTPISPAETTSPVRSGWLDWQRDRRQIWQLLSVDSAESLPETLV